MQEFLDSLSSATKTGLEIFQATQAKPKPAAAPAAKPFNWMPWAIGGAALVGLVVLVPMLRRK